MKRFLALSALISAFVTTGLADEVQIYGGTAKQEFLTSSVNETTMRKVYLINDLTTLRFVILKVDPKAKTYVTRDYPKTAGIDYPFSPTLDKRTRTFIYADTATQNDFVDLVRMRSTAAPATLAVSSTLSRLMARSLSLLICERVSTTYIAEVTGKMTYMGPITIECNDANTNLAGAQAKLVDYLTKRKVIQ